MQGIFPNTPLFSVSQSGEMPAREWVMPATLPVRDYVRTRRALPSGMPDCLEVHVVRFEEGVERSTAVVYGSRRYLVHYAYSKHPSAAP